jgi:hypothetical protein
MTPQPGSRSPTMAGPPPAPWSSTSRAAHRLRGQAVPDRRRQQPETSTPVTGYGEFEGLRLPARGKAIYKLPGGDLDYIDVTVTDLHYDIGAAAPEGRA